MIALCLYQLFMADSIYAQNEELESEEHATHEEEPHIVKLCESVSDWVIRSVLAFLVDISTQEALKFQMWICKDVKIIIYKTVFTFLVVIKHVFMHKNTIVTVLLPMKLEKV